MIHTSKLKSIRKSMGISQVTMGEKLGLKQNNYCMREAGYVDFRKSEIDKIMEITGKKYEELF